MINAVANTIVRTVKYGHRRKALLSGLALVATLLIASGYLLVDALQANVLESPYWVSVHLAESGGLLPNQDVALRGMRIGHVESVTPSNGGPIAVLKIEPGVQIPTSSPVRVSGLSPAGEQYVDFAPETVSGPFLTDGSKIEQQQTKTPVQMYQMLADSDGTLAQLDTTKLEAVKRELSVSKEGPRKMTDIIDGGVFLLSTLDSVLPETVSLLKNSRVVLTSFADMNRGLGDSTGRLNRALGGVAKMDGGFRTLVDRAPGQLHDIDNLFADNSDTMVQLLGNLATVSKLTYLRVPALNALFPTYRGSVIQSISDIIYDHGIWATADVYPRFVCDYAVPRWVASDASYKEPYKYSGYCGNDDPAVLIRGARNAPRPAGDDTASPPAGVDLAATTDPTPKGRFTVPTPYGGPTLPIEPPH